MSEEQVKVEETKEEKVVEEVVVEPSPIENEARGQGWVSQDEWEESGRDPGEWRPAKEFVERGEIFKTLHSVKRELKQEKAAREVLQKHHQYVFEKAHLKAIEDLKRERRVAIRNEDLETAEAIAEEIDELKDTHAKEKELVVQENQKAAASTPNPEFQNWVEQNQWYLMDPDLRDFADASAIVYIKRNPDTSPGAILKHVEKDLRSKFPDKFGLVKKAAPNAVTSVNRTSKTSKVQEVELDDFETQIMNQLVASGEMTAAEYKAEIKKTRIK